MDYGNLVAQELERAGLDSVFGIAMVEATDDVVTLVAHGVTWRVSAPKLLAEWRGTRNGWALNHRVSWAMILGDLEKAKAD